MFGPIVQTNQIGWDVKIKPLEIKEDTYLFIGAWIEVI